MSHNPMDDPPTSSSEDEVPPKQRKIEPPNIDIGHGEELGLELDPTTTHSGLEATPTSSSIEANQTAIQQELSDTEKAGRSEELASVNVEQQWLSSPETERSSSLQIEASTAGEASSSASDNNTSHPQPVQCFHQLVSAMKNIFDCHIMGKVRDLPYPEAVIPPRPALQFYSNAPVEQQQENISQLKDGVSMKITDRLTNKTKYSEFETVPTSSKIEAEISLIKNWVFKMMTDSSTNNSTTNYSGPEVTPTSSKIEANQTGNQQKLSDTEQPGRSEELDSVNVEQQLLSLPGTSGESSSSAHSGASTDGEASSSASDNRSHPPQELNSVNVEQQLLSLPGTSGESSSSAQNEASTDGEASSSASDNNRSPPQSVQGGPEQGSGVVDLGDYYVVGIVGGIPNQINNVGSAPTVLIPSLPALQFYSNEAGSLVQQQYWLIQIQNGTIMNTTFLSTNNSTTNYSGPEATPTSSKIEANQTGNQQKLSDTEQPGRSEELDSVNVEQQSLSLPGTSGESSSSVKSEASRANEASSSASDNNRSHPPQELNSVNVEQQSLSVLEKSGESSSSAQSEASTDSEASSSASDNNSSRPQSVQGVPELVSGVVNPNNWHVMWFVQGIPILIDNSALGGVIPSLPALQFYSNEAGNLVQQGYGTSQIQSGIITNITGLLTNNSTTNYSGPEATSTSSQIEANQTGGLSFMPRFQNPINTGASVRRAVILPHPAPQSNNNEAGSSAQRESTGLRMRFEGTEFVVSHRHEDMTSEDLRSIYDNYSRPEGQQAFTCRKCGAQRVKAKTIQDHIWVQHMRGKFKCPMCPEDSRRTRQSLREHLKKCHKSSNS